MGHALMENGNGLLMDFVVSGGGRVDEDGGRRFRRTRCLGVARAGLSEYFVATAYNLVWMANLAA